MALNKILKSKIKERLQLRLDKEKKKEAERLHKITEKARLTSLVEKLFMEYLTKIVGGNKDFTVQATHNIDIFTVIVSLKNEEIYFLPPVALVASDGAKGEDRIDIIPIQQNDVWKVTNDHYFSSFIDACIYALYGEMDVKQINKILEGLE